MAFMADSGSSNSKGRSVGVTRTSLFIFTGLLTLVLALATAFAIYLARDLDRQEAAKSEFLVGKAFESLRARLVSTTKDYAFWGDAYRHLRLTVSTDWAFVRENLGPTLYHDFDINGVFVVDETDHTVYSVIDGQLSDVRLSAWLGQPVNELLQQARQSEAQEKPVSWFGTFDGKLALIAAAPLTPGTDPSVQREEGAASVLLFVQLFDRERLEAVGEGFGVRHLRLEPGLSDTQLQQLPEATGSLRILAWSPPEPGRDMLKFMLPLVALFAMVVYLMVWVILRRATAAAVSLDQSHTALEHSQAALAISEARFRDVAEASSDWIWETDAEGRFTFLSERFESITGFSRQHWLGAQASGLLSTTQGSLFDRVGHQDNGASTTLQCTCSTRNGSERVIRVTARALPDHGLRGTATDITEDLATRQRIEYLSQHDVLTGLPNREQLRNYLDGKLRTLAGHAGSLVMLSIDLDRFKPVNDLLGHAVGDRVLLETARRLAECVRSGDLVARMGGDEFVMILSGLSGHDEIERLCRRIIACVEQPLELEEQDIFIGASIGIALAPHDAVEAADLLRYSDIALYEAKASGRGTWRFYASDMNARIIERRRLESDLRYGIQHGELRLHFQPRYRIGNGQMVGAEALVRWQHPDRGLVSPDIFIPIAEDTGLISALSDWVLETACQHAAGWPQNLFVSVNLSPKEFQSLQLIERIEAVLSSSGLAPCRLELELTESVMVEDPAGALAIMQSLKALGVRLAMDDFGTGYSSLSYLRSFPFDGLKIDRSFVSRLGESESDRSVVQAIIGLGHALSLTVTAEGIESSAHLGLLQSVDCDEGQGYYLSRPVTCEAFAELLAPA